MLRRKEEEQDMSVKAVWDRNPPESQLAVAYMVIRDVDVLLDMFLRLVRPPYSTVEHRLSPYAKMNVEQPFRQYSPPKFPPWTHTEPKWKTTSLPG